MKNIVVIDSGMNISKEFTKKLKYDFISFCDYQNKNLDDNVGHGTAIMDLYSRILNDQKYTIIKAFDSEEIEEENLVNILKYIYKYINCDIISLSSGIITCKKKSELKEICDDLCKKGVIIVSAYDNMDGITYPACFDSVIGVDWNIKVKHFENFIKINGGIVNLYGCIKKCYVWYGNERKDVKGTSFIVPFVVKKIVEKYDEIEDKTNVEEIVSTVFEGDLVKIQKGMSSNKIWEIKKAVVFPYNKEVDVLLKNEDCLNFKIINYFDIHYRLKSNIVTNNKIKDIRCINWKSDFDTFILSHTREISEIIGEERIYEIINNCVYYRKHLFCFDKFYINENIKNVFKKNDLNLYFPDLNKACVPYENMGKLYVPTLPTVGVMGTSSKQGKYTLQLKMRKIFLQRGIRVGQLGTEPTSLLFGFDEEYVCGYDSFNDLNTKESIMVINNKLRLIEDKLPEIILFGTQSHTIELDCRNISNIPYCQQDFLYAIHPDVVVLCVNIFDEIEYIERTVKFIESLGNTKIIALVLSPSVLSESILNESYNLKTLTDKNYISLFKNNCKNYLGIPVYEFKEINLVVDEIIGYLS